MIGYVYYADQKNTVPDNMSQGIKVAVLVGMIVGDIVFGSLSDKFGRK